MYKSKYNVFSKGINSVIFIFLLFIVLARNNVIPRISHTSKTYRISSWQIVKTNAFLHNGLICLSSVLATKLKGNYLKLNNRTKAFSVLISAAPRESMFYGDLERFQ